MATVNPFSGYGNKNAVRRSVFDPDCFLVRIADENATNHVIINWCLLFLMTSYVVLDFDGMQCDLF